LTALQLFNLGLQAEMHDMSSQQPPALRARSTTDAAAKTLNPPGSKAGLAVQRSVSVSPDARLNLQSDARLNPIHPMLGAWKTAKDIALLTARLQWWLGFPRKWLVQVFRLLLFVLLMLPGFIPPFFTYIFSSKVKKNIVYGPSWRHQLDIYLPAVTGAKRPPVVIFVSGGAWVIGYKAWGFIMGQIFQQSGVLFIAVDYRNFPEVTVGSMVDDVCRAVNWVFEHVDELGGDPASITLMGQSAGAHLSAMAVLEQARREASRSAAAKQDAAHVGSWCIGIARWVGISGPYDIVDVVPTMKNRGLPMRVIQALMESDLSRFSVTRRIRDLAISDPQGVMQRLPPAFLFHGKADETCHWTQSEGLAEALKLARLEAKTKFYEGKSHTDPILEDPCEGPGDELMSDLLNLVAPDATRSEGGFWRLQPKLLLRWAKLCNPF